METNGTPKPVLWRDQLRQVTAWGTRDGEPFVEVLPDDEEFKRACLRNMQANNNHLTTSFEAGRYFLADDPAKGR